MLVGYCDVDYVGERVEQKSTSGGCHYIGPCLISWASKKQNSIALSTTEVEYMYDANCCSQLLQVNYQLEDYSSFENNIIVYCGSTSAINLSKKSIQHSKAKHIEIRYHFFRDYVQKGVFDIKFVDIDHQWTHILPKPLFEDHFVYIKEHLNIVGL